LLEISLERLYGRLFAHYSNESKDYFPHSYSPVFSQNVVLTVSTVYLYFLVEISFKDGQIFEAMMGFF